MSKQYCIARQDDKMFFLPNCRYHIRIARNMIELLRKLDAFCFNPQQVDCLYTFLKYHFGGKKDVKRGQLFDNLQRAVHFNHQNRGVDRIPSIARKRLLRKSTKTFVEFLPKDQIDADYWISLCRQDSTN